MKGGGYRHGNLNVPFFIISNLRLCSTHHVEIQNYGKLIVHGVEKKKSNNNKIIFDSH